MLAIINMRKKQFIIKIYDRSHDSVYYYFRAAAAYAVSGYGNFAGYFLIKRANV